MKQIPAMQPTNKLPRETLSTDEQVLVQRNLLKSNLSDGIIEDNGKQISLKFNHDLNEVQECWEQFELISWHTSFQSFAWVKAWLDLEPDSGNLQPLIVRAYQADKLVFILPLIIEQKNGLKQITWMANDINDYNMPLALAEFVTSASPHLMKKIWQSIATRYSDVDLYSFTMQPEYWEKLKNPFIIEPSVSSSCSTHLMNLRKNWSELYDEIRSKKTQRRLRQKLNKLNKIGDVSFRSPKKQAEKQHLLDIIYTWKLDQLALSGDRRPAVFATLRAVLKQLLKQENSKLVRLLGLYIDGKPVAGMVVFIDKDNFSFFNTSYLPNFQPNCSIGKILLVKSMELAARGGFKYFDFMAGDEAYKTEWTDELIVLKDNFMGLSAKGKLHANFKHFKLRLKKKVKNSRSTMSILRKINFYRNNLNDFTKF